MKRVPVTHRHLWQDLALCLCLTPLLGLTCADMKNTQLVLLGMAIESDRIVYILVVAFMALGILFFLSSRWGKVLCIFFCPLRWYLEARIKYRQSVWLQALLCLTPVVLAQAALRSVFPFERQIAMFKEAAFPQPILICHGIVLSVVMGIFLVYRERFCHGLCPYGIFQNLLRSDVTVVTTLQDPDNHCIDCHACDANCPMHLDVRKQSTETFCSNCTRCIDACRNVLGQGHELITQILEADLPCRRQGGD